MPLDAWLGKLLELLDELLVLLEVMLATALLLALEVGEVLEAEDLLAVDRAELLVALLVELLDAAWLDTGDVPGLVDPLPPPQAVRPAAHRTISK